MPGVSQDASRTTVSIPPRLRERLRGLLEQVERVAEAVLHARLEVHVAGLGRVVLDEQRGERAPVALLEGQRVERGVVRERRVDLRGDEPPRGVDLAVLAVELDLLAAVGGGHGEAPLAA